MAQDRRHGPSSRDRNWWPQPVADAPTRPAPSPGAELRDSSPPGQLVTSECALSPRLYRDARALSSDAGVSFVGVLLSAIVALLATYSGEEDVVVGCELADRAGILPISTRVVGSETARDLARRVGDEVTAALGRTDRQPRHDTEPQFPLVVQLPDAERAAGAVLRFRTGTCSRRAAAATLEHFQNVLGQIVRHPERRVSDFEYLPPDERRSIDAHSAGAAVTFEEPSTVEQLVEGQAERTPDSIAVVYKDLHLSYRTLDATASGLARELRRRGVGPDVLVALAMARGAELVVAIYGTLKAGAAYVAIDPELSADRQRSLLTRAQPRLVLALTSGNETAFAGFDVLAVDRHIAQWASGPHVSSASVDGDNLAYVLYTSGSTGAPKAAMNTRAGIRNRILWMQTTFPLTSSDVVLQKTPFTFDVSVGEFLWTLSAGARLVVAPPGAHREMPALASMALQHQVTTLHFVPSILRSFLGEDDVRRARSIKRIAATGEAVTPALVERFYSTLDATLINLYGPTEASVEVTAWVCRPYDDGQVVPIGRPIANVLIHVLDRCGRPAPADVPGHLYIGGVAVGRGYLGAAALTAERFVPDPFAVVPGARMYATGDRVRRRADGVIEYLGRLDRQVKIRGVAVEPAEIEAVVERHRGVRRCVVTPVHDPDGGLRLVGYVVPDGAAVPFTAELDAACRAALPAPSIPSAWVVLTTLPTLSSGKVDLRRLPAPPPADQQFASPRTPLEELIAGLWAERLHLPRVGIHDNFFQLGGHSLLAGSILARIRADLGVDVPLGRMLEHQTVAGLAAAIEAERRQVRSSPIAPGSATQSAPLSSSQRAIWMLDREVAPFKLPLHNLSHALRIEGPLQISTLERSLAAIVERHSILRTRFIEADGDVQQSAMPAHTVSLPVVDLESLPAPLANVVEQLLLNQHALHPFDLAADDPFRAMLIRRSRSEHVLATCAHHIVMDEWSRSVLVAELADLYRALARTIPPTVPRLSVQYADYALWQSEQLSRGAFNEDLEFWHAALKRGIEPAQAAPAAVGEIAHRLRFTWPGDLADAVRVTALRCHATPFMILLAGLAVLGHVRSGAAGQRIGTVVATRGDAEVEPLIGLFVNTLTIPIDVRDQQSGSQLLEHVRKQVLAAWEHREVPFSAVAKMADEELGIRPPQLFDSMIVFQHVPSTLPDLDGLRLTAVDEHAPMFELGMTVAPCDIVFVFSQVDDQLSGSLVWRTRNSGHETAQPVVNAFRCALTALTAGPDSLTAICDRVRAASAQID